MLHGRSGGNSTINARYGRTFVKIDRWFSAVSAVEQDMLNRCRWISENGIVPSAGHTMTGISTLHEYSGCGTRSCSSLEPVRPEEP